MIYESVKLDKSMYKNPMGFSACLEQMDPSKQYVGSDLAGLDAFERQLKRFDIKVSGSGSSCVAKFFSTADSAALFPEYVSRAVAQGTRDGGVLEEIVASVTDISSLDYRSITTELDSDDYSDEILEGGTIPETHIVLNEHLVAMKKRGRVLSASYEAIQFQRVDVVSVALGQIGNNIAKARMKDAVAVLLGGGSAPESVTASGSLTYDDLLALWSKFDEFDMNVLLASPDMAVEILAIEELKDPVTGLNFQNTGSLSTPLGARLLRSSALPAGMVIGLDKRFALEMVTAGGIQVEHDKLIDSQLERAAVTAITGFNKIFPGAVKVLKK